MMRVVIRCDASAIIGSGHVMRCLTLANVLHENDAGITFLCREHLGYLADQINSSNHRLLQLSAATSLPNGKLAHANWLGTTQEEDAWQTVEAIKNLGHIDWLIVDHYALDINWEKILRSFVDHIMVIDDLADRMHDCDLLLDQNYYLDMASRYENLLSNYCNRLLGPKYALLRPEFRAARDILKTLDGVVKRIFVFFGGSDLTNETQKALRAIQLLDRNDISIDVVLGATNPYKEGITSLCKRFPFVTLHNNISNIAELMRKADLAIGAAGSSTWERCAVALPTLTISVAQNQISIAEGAVLANVLLYLGVATDVTPELIANQIAELLQCPQRIASMAQAGKNLVDSNGCDRVVDAIRMAT